MSKVYKKPEVVTVQEAINKVKESVRNKNSSQNELNIVIEKLDKIIELLTPKEIVINSPISVTSSNEHSLQSKDINEALMNLAQRLDSEKRVAINNRIDKRPIVIERNEEGKRLREGRLYDDGRVEWQRVYS